MWSLVGLLLTGVAVRLVLDPGWPLYVVGAVTWLACDGLTAWRAAR